MCILLSLSLQDSFHWGQTSKGGAQGEQGLFWWVTEPNSKRRRTQEKNTMTLVLNALPPPPKHSITSQLPRITQQLKCVRYPSHQTVTHCMCHNIKHHAGIRLGWSRVWMCAQDIRGEQVGVLGQNGGFVEETWGGCVLRLYIHTNVSSIPFASINASLVL